MPPPSAGACAAPGRAPDGFRREAEPATRTVTDLDMPRMACVEVVALLTINDE